MSIGFGLIKAAAALFIGVCAVAVLAQSSNNEEQAVHYEPDPLKNRNGYESGIFEKIRAWRDSFRTEGVLSVNVTMAWLRGTVKRCFRDSNANKVAFFPLEKLIQEGVFDSSVAEIYGEDATYVLASIDYNGTVNKVMLIQNTGSDDPEVNRLLGKEQMVIITR